MERMPLANITVDEEFKTLIPALSEEERRQLEANILKDGCRDPLTVWAEGGILLDGHNRYEICTRNGVEFDTFYVDLADRLDAKEWIVNNQLGRRNLTAYTRAELALVMESVYAARARENQQVRKGDQSGASSPKLANLIDTRECIARDAGVSHGTLDKAKYIKKSEDEAAEVARKALRRGDKGVSINSVYKGLKNGTIKKVIDEDTGEEHVVIETPERPATPAKPKKFTVMSKAEYEAGAIPARQPASPGKKIAVNLPSDNPEATARALLASFDSSYLCEMISHLENIMEGH